MLWFMSSNPVLRHKEAPTLAKTDEIVDKFVENHLKTGDANDVLYALEASRDYDPGSNLEKIRASLLAINFADDLINPPELGILEREIKRLRQEAARSLIPVDRPDARTWQSHDNAAYMERSPRAAAQGNGKHSVASILHSNFHQKRSEINNCNRRTPTVDIYVYPYMYRG